MFDFIEADEASSSSSMLSFSFCITRVGDRDRTLDGERDGTLDGVRDGTAEGLLFETTEGSMLGTAEGSVPLSEVEMNPSKALVSDFKHSCPLPDLNWSRSIHSFSLMISEVLLFLEP